MSDEELVQTIIELDQSEVLYNKILREPIFTEKLSLDGIKNFMYEILS